MKYTGPPVSVVDSLSEAYPQAVKIVLGKNAPPSLHFSGNLELAYRHGVSFCGARDVSSKGIEAAALCAKTAIKNGFVITSGNARGVDRATHFEAFAGDGYTILVLPEGILNFRIAPELREVWDWDRVLVISQFDPSAIWRSYQAMERNRLIMSLSCAMIVIEAGEKGGTKSAGEDALKLGVPLFAIDYGFDETVAPGNRMLIAKGAKPLKKSRDTGEPNLSSLLVDAAEFCRVNALRSVYDEPREPSFI